MTIRPIFERRSEVVPRNDGVEEEQVHESTHTEMRQHPPEPPTGRERLKWYGPGFLWMISAAASGELLFTPRVGSRYEYTFLWAAIVVIFFT